MSSKEEVSRRSALKVGAAAIIAGVAGAVGGYAAGTAVAPSAPPTPPTPPPTGLKKIKIAGVEITPKNDYGWGEIMFESGQSMKTPLYADFVEGDVPYSDAVPFPQGEKGLRSYAELGYDLIYTGNSWLTELNKVASEFPNTKFVSLWGSGGDLVNLMKPLLLPNLSSGHNPLEQSWFVCGIIMAMATKTGVIGNATGEAYPEKIANAINLELGAKVVDPTIKVMHNYVGAWDDVVRTKETVNALADAGCDVVIHETDYGVFGLIEAAKERNIKWIGEAKDQYFLDPEHVITNYTYYHDVIFQRFALKVVAGTWVSEAYNFSYAEMRKYLNLRPLFAPFRNLPKEISGSVEAMAKKAEDAIASGHIVLPAFGKWDDYKPSDWDSKIAQWRTVLGITI